MYHNAMPTKTKLHATLFAIGLFATACTGYIEDADNLAHQGPTADGVEYVTQPILGGTPAKAGQFRTLVATFIHDPANPGFGFFCSGTLIAPTVVLTAGHCVDWRGFGYRTEAEAATNTLVLFDTLDVFDARQGFIVGATALTAHPQYDLDTAIHDSGVIVLDTAITDRTPSPVDTRTGNPSLIGQSVTLVGYGLTEVDNFDAFGVLYSVKKKPVLCRNVDFSESDDEVVCFDQSDGKGAFAGDSGGPVFQNINGLKTIVGTVSRGEESGLKGSQATRVSNEIAFLDKFLP